MSIREPADAEGATEADAGAAGDGTPGAEVGFASGANLDGGKDCWDGSTAEVANVAGAAA